MRWPEMLIEELLRGAEVLDRKKAEIRRFVPGLIGLINENPSSEVGRLARGQHVFRDGNFEWWVFRIHGNGPLCINARFQEQLIYSTEENNRLSYRHIELVHAHLPTLVRDLIKTYPGLMELMQPIVAAAHNASVVKPVPLG